MRATPEAAGLGLALLLAVAPAWGQPSAEPHERWETAEWTGWRGAARDGVSDEDGLASQWPEDGPPRVWSRPLGAGFSAVVAAGGRLFTQFADKEQTYLASFAARDGRELWRIPMGRVFKNNYGNGPRATPALSDGMVYALSSSGTLVAARAASGEVVWRSDLKEQYGARPPRWGLSGSPLVEGSLLIVAAGGDAGRSVLAFDKAGGELRWSARDDKAGYASPIAMTLDGVRQLLVFAGDRIVSLRPETGETYWELGWKTSWGVNAAMPIRIDERRVFLSSGYDKGAVLLEVRKTDAGFEVAESWRNREMRNKFSSSVLWDGHLYGFDEGTLKCFDPASGTTQWRKRGLGHGSLFAADGKLIVMSDSGEIVLVRASPDEYRELARAQVTKTRTWTVPTLAGGRLYLRDETELVALDVSGGGR